MSSDSKNNITIKASDLKKTAESEDAWDYLFNFTDKYFDALNENPNAMSEFNDSQLTLLTYNYLYGEVVNGGFIQMIINGKECVFEPSFSETIKSWGAIKIAEIVDKARIIYEKNKVELLRGQELMVEFSKARSKVSSQNEADLLRRKMTEEHSEIYSSITDFEPLENDFYECMDEETAAIKRYAESNSEKFGNVV